MDGKTLRHPSSTCPDVYKRQISKWVKISTPSIYKKVIQLEEKGYISSHIEKEGKMPEKSVYSLTEKEMCIRDSDWAVYGRFAQHLCKAHECWYPQPSYLLWSFGFGQAVTAYRYACGAWQHLKPVSYTHLLIQKHFVVFLAVLIQTVISHWD